MLLTFGGQDTLTEDRLEGATSAGWLGERVGVVEDVRQGGGIGEEQSSGAEDAIVGYDATVLFSPLKGEMRRGEKIRIKDVEIDVSPRLDGTAEKQRSSSFATTTSNSNSPSSG